MSDFKYLQFIHELTIALYDKDIVIPFNHGELIECFYLQKFSIEKSVEQYIAHIKSRPELQQ